MYKPLPNYLKVEYSTIEGQGLFVKGTIAKDTVIGVMHVTIDSQIIRTPLGGFLNHSETPNVSKYNVGIYTYIKAIRDIEYNEELTLKYTLYNPSKQIV